MSYGKKAFTIKVKSKANARVEPPFPALPSFNCAATILSFVNFDEEVKDLLSALSHNTRNYYKKHMNILEGFVIDVPPLIKQKAFGDKTISVRPNEVVDFEFPTRDEAKQMKLRGRKAEVDDITLEPRSVFYGSIQVRLKNDVKKNYVGTWGGNENRQISLKGLSDQKVGKVSLLRNEVESGL